ncbi:MAG: cell division protein FtsL, partial [Acidimicrobiales bacterium]|nr:cell division protein FtsL [Acidimicrobiales bacterium]
MATRAAELGRTSPRPNPRGGTRTGTAGARPRSPRPSQDARVRVVQKPTTRTRSARQNRRLLVTLCTMLTVGLAFSVVASQVFVAQNQDRLDKLNQQITDAQASYDRLRYEVAELESPERVAAAAQAK